MKPQYVLSLFLMVFSCGPACGQAQDADKALVDLADKLAASIKDSGKKKVTVLDFTGLEGGSTDLGKYVAEELTVNLVMERKDFSVLDRANLKTILAEHKLTAEGLIDPENAKQLGKFSGVDALILGTVTPKGTNVSLTAKIITTDTAEIVGAARAEFKIDDSVQQLLSHAVEPVPVSSSVGDSPKMPGAVMKTLGDLRMQLSPLRIQNNQDYAATITFTNLNANKSIWIAVHIAPNGQILADVTDPSGNQFELNPNDNMSAMQCASTSIYGYQPRNGFMPATEIKAGDSITSILPFRSLFGKQATPGSCTFQVEFLMGHDFGSGRATVETKNCVLTVETK